MDKQIATMIFAWISKNLDDCENPRIHGKGLVADEKGIWRYRVGDYELLDIFYTSSHRYGDDHH